MCMISCSLVDDRDIQPAYLSFNEVSVRTEPYQGYDSQNITDLWVYVDDQLLGVFPLGTDIPVILKNNKEEVNVKVFAGIRNNGQVAVPFIYQLYSRIDFDTVLKAGETYQSDLEFKYGEAAIFPYIEEFEGGHSFSFEGDDDTETKVELNTSEAIYGARCGHIRLTKDHPLINTGIANAITGENLGHSEAYLELDYKNNMPFLMSIALNINGNLQVKNLWVAKEKNEWNKVYIDLSSALSDKNIVSYQILLSATLERSSLTEGLIYIDNVKVVHL